MADDASLEETPTWAVSVVCFFLITISILIEHALLLLHKLLRRRKRKSLIDALNKIKAELMMMGFISLFLTVGESPISKICIPKSIGDSFLPCKNSTVRSDLVEEPTCQEKGKISLVSREGLKQLNILIFVFAFFHVLSCLITMALGMAKMKHWRSWEDETKTLEYQFCNDPRRFKLSRQTSFGRRHLKFWSNRPLLLWLVCFLRQFHGSVYKADYFVLRHGFITAHIAEGSNFDFQKFLRRALDEDFRVVVGIRLWIWICSILFIFFNAQGFYDHLWLPFVSFILVLMVGTKLQLIITKLCLQSREEGPVVRGTLLVKPNDNLFWFGRPQCLLHLIHFILFQNAFQLAFFTWTWYEFGLKSCFHRRAEEIAISIAMGLLVQLLCGYVTLPLYALVTQMGSSMKKVVFTHRVAKGLKRWHATAERSLATRKSVTTTPLPEPPSPSYTVGTLLPDIQEIEMPEVEILPTETPVSEIEITEEGRTQLKTNTEGSYDGEISFGWLAE